MTLVASSGTATRLGSRTSNQDRCASSLPWMFVLDGVGGSEDGGAAAQLALAQLLVDTAKAEHRFGPLHQSKLLRLVEHAHSAVTTHLGNDDGTVAGATTLTLAHMQARSDGLLDITVCTVGDSPAWVLGHDSVPVRANSDPERTYGPRSLPRALGWPDHAPEIQFLTVETPCRITLATDGLEAVPLTTRDALIGNLHLTSQVCATQLADAAIAAGGRDNTTVLVVDVAHAPDAPFAVEERLPITGLASTSD